MGRGYIMSRTKSPLHTVWMLELALADFDRVLGLVPAPSDAGHMAFVHAVLEGSMPGFVLVDAAAVPKSAIVGNLAGFWFALGEPPGSMTGDEIVEIRARVPGDEPTALWCTSPGWAKVLTPHLGEGEERIEFHPPATPRATLAAPAGYELRPLDAPLAATFQASGVDPWVVDIWGGAEAFAARSFGFALLKHGNLVSFCTACALQERGVGREAEIEIGTTEGERDKGLAEVAGRAFMVEARVRGYVPAWTCAAANPASERLALKLGYTEARRVRGFPLAAAGGDT